MAPVCARRAALVVALGLAGAGLGAQAEVLSEPVKIDKSPRIAGDWVAWTEVDGPVDSNGRVIVLDRRTGEKTAFGPGFRPDVDEWIAQLGAVPTIGDAPLAVARRTVRVAFVRPELDGQLSVASVRRLPNGDWQLSLLATDLDYVDHVRVDEDATAWVAPDATGRLRVHVHDGEAVDVVSGLGHAFRSELARTSDGVLTAVWDAYVGGAGAFDYEIFTARREAGGWTPPVNLSNSPLSADLNPHLAAAPDGGVWFAWTTDRGATLSFRKRRTMVVKRLGDTTMLPNPFGATEPAIVDLATDRAVNDPVLAVDEHGRPWLFVNELAATWPPFDKIIRYSVYDGDAWLPAAELPGGPYGDLGLDVDVVGRRLDAVYQSDQPTGVDVLATTIELPEEAAAPDLAVGEPVPDAPGPFTFPTLTRAQLADGSRRLVFGDFHSHSDLSPDGVGELDHALLWARDQIGLDAWASTEHDQRQQAVYLDYEFDLTRRLLALFDSPTFAAFVGFEWTNDANACGDGVELETIGHRATFDSSAVYRYTTPPFNSLPAFYAALLADDAIGVPHHLGLFGGATFLDGCFDAVVQPVAEIVSAQGLFELELTEKMRPPPDGDGKRFGVIAAGDNHGARPGAQGLASIWVETGVPLRDAIKMALRERRCYGVALDGIAVDLSIEGAAMGETLTVAPGAELRLDYEVLGLPTLASQTQQVNVNLVDVAQPDYLSEPPASLATYAFRPGEPAPAVAEVDVPLPTATASAIYMLRVTAGTGLAPGATLAWATPIWVDVAPAAEAPEAAVRVTSRQDDGGAPVVDVALAAAHPRGVRALAAPELRVQRDGLFVGAWRVEDLARVGHVDRDDTAVRVTLEGLAPGPGTWELRWRVTDERGRLDVASALLEVAPSDR